MQFFGGASKAPQARAPGAKASGKPIDPSEYPTGDTPCVCCAFFIFLLFLPVSIVCLYHAAPTSILSLTGVWVMITLTPWAFHAGGVVVSDISGPMLTVTMFMSVILSFMGGVRCYYEQAQPMRQLMLAREYKGVYPELPGVGFPDAAYLEFSGNATVDTSKAVGYQSLDSGLTTICVAPIVTSASSGRHDFWAIGVDCCGDTGDKFECYDAGEPGVHTGWVLPPKFGDTLFSSLGIYLTKAEYRRDLFGKAVKKAEAIHGIAGPGDEAVFVRWTKQTKDDIVFWQSISIGIAIAIFAVATGAASLFMTRLYQRFQNLRRVHHQRLHGDMGNSEEEDMQARLQQFMADALEGANDSDFAGTIDRVKGATSAEALQNFRPPLSASDMCLMGVLLPYLMLMSCVVLSTYMPCSRWGHLVLAPFWCLTLILVIALLATPNRAVSGFFILICCTCGYYVGNVNYKDNMFHHCSVSDRRLYTEVKAEANTADYWDAGKLHFEASTMLSTNHSVGFLYQGTSYCAAPVISKMAPCKDGSSPEHAHGMVAPSNVTSLLQVAEISDKHVHTLAVDVEPALTFMQRRSSRHHSRRARVANMRSFEVAQTPGCKKIAPAQIDFWAIGIDCCDARGRFWCHGGEFKDAHQAVVVRAQEDEDAEHPKLKSDRQHFFQAIDQAVATYELPLPDRPVLLHWGMDSDQLTGEWKKRAVGVILMTGLASLLLILAIGITSFCFMKRQRRLEKRSIEDFDKRHTGQGNEATVYDTPRQSLQPADVDQVRRNRMSEDEMRF